MSDTDNQPNAAGETLPPEEEQSWPKSVTRVVATQVKFWRDRRELSANELSRRTAQLGSEVPRSVIANLETGRRESVSVDELLILGAALDVPPLLLLTPVGQVKNLRILPEVESSPWFSRGWIIGARLVEYAGSNVQKWRDGRRAVALYDVHRTLVQQYAEIQSRIRRVADQTQLASATGVDRTGQQRFLQALVNELARSLHALRTHRQLIEREGFLVPEVPPGLTTLLSEVEVPDEEDPGRDDWGTSLADQSAAEELLLLMRQAQSGRPTDDS
ncbi:helix-turn-helix domain-containing protein [Dactylosporangium sp. CA-139066]|uniref:helix-turn-helix domain-containing protein n=1 Tax=Dactylosporangium sp. CA-139066 TaxID=3239930 RepID=UPI003D8D8B08